MCVFVCSLFSFSLPTILFICGHHNAPPPIDAMQMLSPPSPPPSHINKISTYASDHYFLRRIIDWSERAGVKRKTSFIYYTWFTEVCVLYCTVYLQRERERKNPPMAFCILVYPIDDQQFNLVCIKWISWWLPQHCRATLCGSPNNAITPRFRYMLIIYTCSICGEYTRESSSSAAANSGAIAIRDLRRRIFDITIGLCSTSVGI